MKLTKEQTLEEHRKMWNWIADQYENGRIEDICTMKAVYMEKAGYRSIKYNCFCCEYAIQKSNRVNRCLNCPVIWCTEVYGIFCRCEYSLSAYQKLRDESFKSDADSELCARLAREIANLPERECV